MTAHLTVVPETTTEPAPALTATPLIEQERDGSVTHEVHVTLSDVEWRMLVGDIAARVLHLLPSDVSILGLLLAAGRRPCDADQQEALSKLLAALKGPTHPGSQHSLPPTFVLTPDDVLPLVDALIVAADDPVECPCGAVVQQPTQLTTTCGGCVDRLGGDR